VKVTPNGQFKITQATAISTTITSPESTTLTLGAWAMVYVSYSFTSGGYGASNIYVDGKKSGDAITVKAYGSSVFSSSDRVRFGEGFIGQIRRIQVYSPAAWRVNPKPCDSTTCALDIGFSIPPTCIQAVCITTGTYTSFGSCESKTLINYFESNFSKKGCPKGCSACTDATTCQSCHSDYYHDGTRCLKCPQGQYIDSPTSCARILKTSAFSY